MSRDQHTIILPYFCEDEVERYLRIAKKISTFEQPENGYQFLLASSPRTETSSRLIEAYSKLGNAIPFACPTQIFGYPEGPTAMFWDCMEYLANNFAGSTGFGLWLESDMAPVKSNWLDRLSDEWYGDQEVSGATPIMMGCFVPEVYKYRLFKKPKLILHPHINGGACYAMDFARHVPEEGRQEVFDMAVFKYANELGRAKFTRQIAFSTVKRMRRDLMDDTKVLLHGFMQEKDQFIDGCLAPPTEQELGSTKWHSMMNRLETMQRQLRVKFVRKGRRAMLENMFLAKEKFERDEDQNPSSQDCVPAHSMNSRQAA